MSALPLHGARAATLPPVLDAHVHLFDPRRAGGVPWPEESDPVVYKPALPDRLEALAAPLGVVGAIAIEASPLQSDNDWLLQMCDRHPYIVGCIGNLDPAAADFHSSLARLRQNRLFLGIRYGNLWKRNLDQDLERPGFWEGLQALADAGLVLETANPDAALIGAVSRVAQQLPTLRIVVDHLPNAVIPGDAAAAAKYWQDLHSLGTRQQVFIKLSEIPTRVNGRVSRNANDYRAHLDALWNIFGDDRVLFGSDWPNSDHVLGYAATLHIVREYASGRSQSAREKLFWKNSEAAYRWSARRAAQRLQQQERT